MGESDSKPWAKIIIFIIVAVVIVAAIVMVVITCCRKEKEEKKNKRSGGRKRSSNSQSKSAKKHKKPNTGATKKMSKPVLPQVPLKVKPVDETATPSASNAPTQSPTNPTDTVPESAGTSAEDSAKRVRYSSEESEEQKERVTVLCTYGKGWKAKTEAPKDFTFSIESD